MKQENFPRTTVRHGVISEMIKSLGRPILAIGLDPRKLLALRYVPKYLADRRAFKRAGGVINHTHPVLDEFSQQAGLATGHYFHQDLLVATLIRKAAPDRHIDVGSRVDGFVAHVASFRTIEVMDIRPLSDAGHENIRFMQADLMSENPDTTEITDSLSCLHALEHFGLGRYRDPIDPLGHIKGFNNLCRMVRQGGIAYISFPIGMENAVYFNAHRVFHPRELLRWADGTMELVRFDFVDDVGALHQEWPLHDEIPQAVYGCGIYTLRKVGHQ